MRPPPKRTPCTEHDFVILDISDDCRTVLVECLECGHREVKSTFQHVIMDKPGPLRDIAMTIFGEEKI